MEDNEEKANDLIKKLKDGSECMRQYAAMELWGIDYSKTPKLRNKVVKELIAVLIGDEKTPKDESGWVRRGAARALGEMEAKEAVGPLIRALKDENGGVRFSAARALRNIGDVRAVGPLIEALEGGYEGLYREAALTLRNITSELNGTKLKEIITPEGEEILSRITKKVPEEALVAMELLSKLDDSAGILSTPDILQRRSRYQVPKTEPSQTGARTPKRTIPIPG